MRRITLLILVLNLSACASFSSLKNGLDLMMNEQIDLAVAVFGYPDGEREFGSKTVYYWTSQASGYSYAPYRDPKGDWGMAPVSDSSQCNLKIIASSITGRMKSWEYSGSRRACSWYIEQAKQYHDDATEFDEW